MSERRVLSRALPNTLNCKEAYEPNGEIIRSKAQNYRLYDAGAYGNKLRTWTRLQDIEKSGFSGKVVMRYRGASGGAQYPRLGEQVSLAEAKAALHEWVKAGADIGSVGYNEAAPDHALVIQGEILLSTEHVSLFYSTKKATMRAALREANQIEGLRAVMLLRQSLFPSSLDDVRDLFARYPSAVIEFSAYEYPVGHLRGRNTVIWEVRNY
ncbi:MAG: hypothetical protein JO170_17295 [Verrucomicrobia bacterium]|nr:hypothetical protein [Verrucomicrobiota bacterium]